MEGFVEEEDEDQIYDESSDYEKELEDDSPSEEEKSEGELKKKR